MIGWPSNAGRDSMTSLETKNIFNGRFHTLNATVSFRQENGHKIYERPSHADCDKARSLGGEAHHEWHPTRAKCGKCATATWPATNVQAR